MFCYQSNFTNPTMPVDEAQFTALVRGTKWAEMIDKFRETGDAQLQAISKDLRAAFDQAFISHAQVSNLPGSINANTLSVTIVDKATYNMELTDDTGWTFLFGDSYKINDFHADTGWGDWLAKNEQKPTGNPSGFQESESGEK